MSTLSEQELHGLKRDLEELVGRLRVQIAQAGAGARPVDLDEPIGRLSRMDAMQQQKMLEANRNAARQRVARCEGALRRLEADEYGECIECGEDVGYRRLKARPESSMCVTCQSGREAIR